MMTDDAMDRLVEDIKQEGQIEPCIVNSQGVLLDGRNRVAACERLGIAPIVRTVSPVSETAFIASLNIHRRHLTKGERQALMPLVAKSFEDEAQKRRRDGNARGGRGGGKSAADLQPTSERAMAQAAKLLDVSERAGYSMKHLAETDPELAEAVKVGDLTLHAAEKRLKQNLDTVQWMRDEKIGEPEPAAKVTAPADPDPVDLAFLEGAAARLAKARVTWTQDERRVARAEQAILIIIEHAHRLSIDNRRNP
jgi:ParB-like chromosome segregation protein Spo0J